MDPLKTEETERAWAAAGPALLESLWRYRWMVLGITVLAGLLGFAVSHLQPTVYEAKASLLLSDPSSDSFDGGRGGGVGGDRYIRNQAQIVSSPVVAARAAELAQDRFTPADFSKAIKAEPTTDVDLLTIRAQASTREAAVELADYTAEAYQAVIKDRTRQEAEEEREQLIAQQAELQAELDTIEEEISAALDAAGGNAEQPLRPADLSALVPGDLQARRDAAMTQLVNLRTRLGQIDPEPGSGVELFQEARAPAKPLQPRPARNGAATALLGLFGSGALAWWRAEHSRVAERRQDPAPVLRAPLLGQVPDFKSAGVVGVDPTRTAPHSAPAEAYQFIIASLQHALQQTGASSVLVTSASPADGKTVTALNLAVAAARDGRRVLLADGDGRALGLTSLADVAPSPGLTDLADTRMPFEGCVASISTPGETLSLIPAGTRPHDPAGFFRTPGFRKAMTRIKERADLVIIDTPPLLAVSDTSAIAGQVDGIVIVVSRGTSLSLIEEMRERLEFVGTPVLGYVFNKAAPRSGYGGYGYGYGYGYGSQEDSPDGSPRVESSPGLGSGSGNGSSLGSNGLTPAQGEPTPVENPHRRI